jgi:ParB family transcriptional regulator, chromosome partitioning protein
MTVRAERTGALGRGLAALIPQRSATNTPTDVPLARIRFNPFQPRKRVDETRLEELVASIREHGVIQPVLVTETLDGYQLVAGERRVRAAILAGLDRIPAVIRQLTDRDQLELAIVENVQRADLNAIEEANAYRQLIDEFGFSQEQVAARIGRARPTVANTLRLLELARAVQDAVAEGRVSEGHGRALGVLPEVQQRQVLDIIERESLSVRQTEELVRRLRDAADGAPKPARASKPDADLERVEEELRQALGTKVSLARSRRGGRIVIEYYSDEELGRLYERLVGGVA